MVSDAAQKRSSSKRFCAASLTQHPNAMRLRRNTRDSGASLAWERGTPRTLVGPDASTRESADRAKVGKIPPDAANNRGFERRRNNHKGDKMILNSHKLCFSSMLLTPLPQRGGRQQTFLRRL